MYIKYIYTYTYINDNYNKYFHKCDLKNTIFLRRKKKHKNILEKGKEGEGESPWWVCVRRGKSCWRLRAQRQRQGKSSTSVMIF